MLEKPERFSVRFLRQSRLGSSSKWVLHCRVRGGQAPALRRSGVRPLSSDKNTFAGDRPPRYAIHALFGTEVGFTFAGDRPPRYALRRHRYTNPLSTPALARTGPRARFHGRFSPGQTKKRLETALTGCVLRQFYLRNFRSLLIHRRAADKSVSNGSFVSKHSVCPA